MKLIQIMLFFVLVNANFLIAQNLPIDNSSNEVVYTDLALFDTLTADTAFIHMSNYVSSNVPRYFNIQPDSNRLLIRFTGKSNAYSKFPNEFGEIEYDIVIRYFPNKFAYRITNFRHVPKNNFPPCSNNLNLVMPKCFEGKPYGKYWKNVKKCAIDSMNDFILKLLYVTLENQPTKKTLKMDDYFLVINRN